MSVVFTGVVNLLPFCSFFLMHSFLYLLSKRLSQNQRLNYIYVPDNFGCCCDYFDCFAASSDPYMFPKMERHAFDQLYPATTRANLFPRVISSSAVLCLLELNCINFINSNYNKQLSDSPSAPGR